MDLIPHFATPLWLFALIVAPGLWLTHALYGLPGVPGGRRPRQSALALTYGLAWVLLATWVLSPTWRSRPEIWHPPAVLLITDESPRYATLGARDSAQESQRAARAHYQALGFRVEDASFENAASGPIASPPNVQAVFLWSDGRGGLPQSALRAPRLFPVVPGLSTREVQGESAFVADGEREDGPGDLVVMWRALGVRAVNARAELRSGTKVLWRGILSHPIDGSPCELIRSRLPAVVGVEGLPEGANLLVLIRPEGQTDPVIAANDTVRLSLSASRQMSHTFVRPLSTLAERALMDALRDEPGARVAAQPVGALSARANGVIWVQESKTAAVRLLTEQAAMLKSPVIIYRLSENGEPQTKFTAFGPDARIERAAQASAFIPAGALRLADLGVTDGSAALRLEAPSAGVEPIAWALQDGRRGLLVWRNRATGTYGFMAPPLWTSRFQAGAAARAGGAALASAWVRGSSNWVRAHHAAPGERGAARAKTARPRGDFARLGADLETLAALAARHNGEVMRAGAQGPALPSGEVRERRARTTVLTPPFVTALVIAILLSALWAWRKRRQLD